MRRSEDERGQSLLLALFFVLALAVAFAVILDFSMAGMRNTVTVRDTRNLQHDVGSAATAEINRLRGSSQVGSLLFNGGDCSSGMVHSFADSANVDLKVTCQALPVAGGPGGPDQPTYAMLTLGQAPGEGINFTGNNGNNASTATTNIDGGIFSNGQVQLGGPLQTITVNGDVQAVNVCDPKVGSNGGIVACNLGSGKAEADPNYPAAMTVADFNAVVANPAKVDPTPTCASSNSIVRFYPGYYSQTPDSLVPSGCKGNTWWFGPDGANEGVYYFAFPDAQAVWNLGNTKVVGGTLPAGFSANSASLPNVPGACDSSDTKPGVQFLLGGPSAISLASLDQMELCANKSAQSNQHIALYGLSTGTRSAGATQDLYASNVQPGTSPNVANPNAALGAFDEVAGPPFAKSATFGLAATPNQLNSASETFAFPSITGGSVVNNAKLLVRHAEDPNVVTTVNYTIGSTTYSPKLTPCLAQVPPATALPCTDTIDISSQLPAKFSYNSLNSLKVTVTMSAPFKPKDPVLANGYLDAVDLQVGSTAPAFEAIRCPNQPPSPAPNCPLLKTFVNSDTVIHGTVYAPTAFLDLALHNGDVALYTRGVIARTITADGSASFKQEESPFQIPTGAAVTRNVLFTVYKASDSAQTHPLLRAKVQYLDYVSDPAGDKRAFPGRAIEILNWSVLR